MALTVKPLGKVRKTVPVQKVVQPIEEPLVRVNLDVEKKTRQRWRAEALKRDIPLKELIQQAVEQYLK